MLTLIVTTFSLLPHIAEAQAGAGDDPDTIVPVDGGLSILTAAGLAYGVKKIKEH